ncbi:hypothetical protein L1987_53057 [Smallanthus sonchifolius]|uniref:Uncharacterized protein n=1 Tax=Smallanthus sonchifolius TaxID=185202 RepID=A0ACB9EVH0_9ASTR|nr:hypothetical protein L1987_53057 [Smallanthus sonchifolius]
MDHSWRPPLLPPIPGNNTNICPICSILHFPFCPPSPFIENPRFHYSQPQNDYHFQRPPFDHHHPFPNPQSLLKYNYCSNPTWYGSSNPNLNMSPYEGPGGGLASANYGYDNGGIKRTKIDNNRRPVLGGEIGDMSRFPSDSERLLKLIHDHGNAVNATPGLFSEPNGDVRLKRRCQVNEISSMGLGSFERKEPYLYDQSPLSHHSDYSSQPAADAMQPNRNLLSSRVPIDGHCAPNSFGGSLGSLEVHHGYGGQPPPPASPPPPLPTNIPQNHFLEPHATPPLPKKPPLFPVSFSSSADSSSCSAVLENQSSALVYYTNSASCNASFLSSAEEFHFRQSSSEKHARDIQPFPLRHLSSEKQNSIDASHIFNQPHRTSRPDHFVIILRGLPGSGKRYLAKMLRDIEVENGGEAPRIHSMDEYFMIEVEKAEDSEFSKSSSSLRGKRQVMKTMMEYCYEPEMEEAYRASMLKAFRKTLDEGVYSFIIVDDRNLRVADFAQFWATAKLEKF